MYVHLEYRQTLRLQNIITKIGKQLKQLKTFELTQRQPAVHWHQETNSGNKKHNHLTQSGIKYDIKVTKRRSSVTLHSHSETV